jgi:hypothetical protein
MTNKAFIAKQMNRFFQIMAQQMQLDEETSMEIADLYEAWEVNKAYSVGKILKYGVNADGETQLYSVIQAHTSQDTWKPDATPSLYKKIGFADSGVPIWTQPLGASDAYAKGDKVSYDGKLWESDVDANVWQPGVYGWHEVTE